jgi:hypothetical protein
MSTLDDFFGDGLTDSIPEECSFCGGTDGELVVSVEDHYGPTHWHHEVCKTKVQSKSAPTWDEAMDEAQN